MPALRHVLGGKHYGDLGSRRAGRPRHRSDVGVHLVFFLHITTGPDSTHNVLALASGVLIVFLVLAGSLVIPRRTPIDLPLAERLARQCVGYRHASRMLVGITEISSQRHRRNGVKNRKA